MAALNLSTKSASVPPKQRWFEKIMAAIALLNFGLVIFDLSYIPLRDVYLQQFPELTRWYGRQFKGIEPHRVTTAYLETIDQLENQVATDGLTSPEAEELLSELRIRSAEIIDENPFEIADKTGTLERIKDRMREHVSAAVDEELESSKEAFSIFWSRPYLTAAGFNAEMDFLSESITPLIETNYYRNIGFDGKPLDQFWLIDLWFISIFGLEFLARTWYLSRRFKGTSWFDTMLWRWYDILLLIPFSTPLWPFAKSWVLLRIIPVIIRINQSNLLDLEPLRDRITRGIVANFAVELTEIVVLRIIDQVQNLIRQGEVSRALLEPETVPRYIDLNDIDEIKIISQRLSSTMVYQVLPKIRPDIEALLRHNITHALEQSPAYAGIQRLPGVNSLSDQLTQQLVSELYKSLYGILTDSLKDDVGAKLTQQLLDNLGSSFRTEIQKDGAVQEIESLVTVWLDEVKINYVKRLAAEDVERLREQTQKLYEITQGTE